MAESKPAPGRAPGELSDAEHDAVVKEMKQLERSDQTYDRRTRDPTPRYAELRQKIEDHVNANADRMRGR
jgi:hypothetical protein